MLWGDRNRAKKTRAQTGLYTGSYHFQNIDLVP